MSYAELDLRARAIGFWLTQRGAANTPVLLAFSSDSLDFLLAFLGCLYAGAIAVPVPPMTDTRSIERTRGIVLDAGINVVLTTVNEKNTLRGRLGGLRGSLTFKATDTLPDELAPGWAMPDLDRSSVAVLQYTSGSTGEPKGVVVTHGNLLHNEQQIKIALDSDDRSVGVGWLPHFHDMGLVGLLLHPLYVGGNCAFMAPSAFMKRPIRWLEAITFHAATMTVAPDFAYELCARVVTDAQLSALNLSSLKCALNGAEPVRAATLAAFSQRFAPAGFSARSFVPCYGMAESTLLAAGKRSGSAPVTLAVVASSLEGVRALPAFTGCEERLLVSSGTSAGLDVRIVDPVTHHALPDFGIGEIWLRGDSVANGYWKRPETTQATFGAKISGDDGPYLRTGDLGFLADGELFVTGRLKDVMIVNGRNLYPQDIEDYVRREHAALIAGSTAVFAVEVAGMERIVIVQDVRDKSGIGQVAQGIKRSVGQAFDVAVPGVVLVKRGGVQLTTSGKVQRGRMRELFMANELDALYEDIQPAVQALRRSANGVSAA